MAHRLLATVLILGLLSFNCGKKSGDISDVSAVVALTGDVDNFNPVVATSSISSEVNSMIYPMMFDVSFDLRLSQLVYKPGLVKNWTFLNDGKDVRLAIRNDVRWQDGTPVTTRDIRFTYELVGDPLVASPRSNYVDNMMMTDGKFDPNKSMTVESDTVIIFHFSHKYPQQLYHLNLSPIPEHVFRNADRMSLATFPANNRPVSAGPFKLERWTRNTEIVLSSNPMCVLPFPAKLQQVVMRIIPEPTTRLAELKAGTVDIMWPVYPEDAKVIQAKNTDIRLEVLPPRSYEYIGWANIDFDEWRKSGGKVVKPHRLFGDKRVRQALTYAINRAQILEAKLGTYGELAISDFSPVFRWALNTDLLPYSYDVERARQLLRAAGWFDTDGDGILDKDGVRFEFTLNYNAGNLRREYVATVVQDNLKQLGIKVNISSSEANVHKQNIDQKKYDAFVAGFSVGLAIDPSSRWGDIHNTFNSTGFTHPRINELIKLGMNVSDEKDAAKYWKEMQEILHEEQPCTFMYWIKDIIGVNRRIKSTNINILGVLDNMWDWKIGDPNTYATF
jgi:peptide/nickel transport system substrate-binding protein